MTKLAVIDVGTNSIHMVLAEIEPEGSYKILDRFKNMARLGDGAFQHRRLSDTAMARGLEAIRTLVTLAKSKGYDRIEAVATSAVREAENGGDFLKAVTRETDVTIRIVSGQEEARLIYLGVRQSIHLDERPAMVVDVGGGSVELIVGNRERLLHGQSLKLGAIRLKDHYLQRDPQSAKTVARLRRAVAEQLKEALKRVRWRRIDRLIATSGMAGNLAEIVHLRRTGRPLPQLNLATIDLKDIQTVEKLLARSSLKARLAIPGLDAKRADTLLPATMVIRTLMQLIGVDRLTLSDKAIREGLIYRFIEQHWEGLRAEQEIPNVRRRNVVFLARRCHAQEGHAQHVAKLAARLFDDTRSLHTLTDHDRELLEYAAILHDIGYLINSRQHHKHAYYLIKHADLAGFAADEIEMIANIARYHRRAMPQAGHTVFAAMSREQRRRLRILSALLRMADGLDRTQFSVVQDLSVDVGRRIVVSLRTVADAELEIWAARNRADLFEAVFKRPVHFRVTRTGETL